MKKFLILIPLLFLIGCAATPTATTPKGCISGNCENGAGTYKFSDEGKYYGNWKNGKFEGQGTLTFANGDKYVGEWKNDLANGKGTCTWTSGEKYIGEFKNNVREGQGTYTYADGTIKKGIWKDGFLIVDDLKAEKELAKQKEKEEAKLVAINLKKGTCIEMGFTDETEGMANCILQLTLQDNQSNTSGSNNNGVVDAMNEQTIIMERQLRQQRINNLRESQKIFQDMMK